MLLPNFRIVFQLERSTDDIAGFINNIIGTLFELSNNNSSSFGLLARQEEEDHNQDIIAFCFNHLKNFGLKNEENSINYDVYLEFEDWIVPTVKVIYCNFFAGSAHGAREEGFLNYNVSLKQTS
jgi:hypothetical protein